MTEVASTHHPRFLITEGGPTYRIEIRVGLIRANSDRTLRSAFFSILITWVPLLLLSAAQGTLTTHLVPVSFLSDFAVHARFLLAVPIMLAAETILGPRLACAAAHFVTSGLIAEHDFGKFDVAVEHGLQWRDSTRAELLLLVLAYISTIAGLSSTAVHVSSWYAWRTTSGISLTLAGWWFVLLCVPLFQFLCLRWLWRLFLWGQFLWRMNNLQLQLIPTHPDEAGGLAFVGESQRFFAIVLFAYSIAVAGILANGILYDGYSLTHFAPVIGAYVLIAVGIIILPMLVFFPSLEETKREGLYRYGTLATEYTSSFQQKWTTHPRQTDEVLLGTGDIQSLADLGNSFAFVEKMNLVPIGSRTPIQLTLACLLPMAPLLLTMMPLKEILKMVFKIVL
jgi:hypothetical protein